jgi:hypothetical protein
MKLQNQKGFSALIIVLLIALVGVIGFVGWRMYDSSQQNKNSQTSVIDKNEGWLSYTDPVGNFTIRYPDNWSLKTDPVDTTNSMTRAKLTSPSGVVLNMITQPLGLGGGLCYPDADDKPFQPNNECQSIQDLSSEKLNTAIHITDYKDETGRTLVKGNVYLITRHYSNPKGTLHAYYIGLVAGREDLEHKFLKPRMGAVYFSAPFIAHSNPDIKYTLPNLLYAESSDPNFLTSPDAETIKDILRTFKFER